VNLYRCVPWDGEAAGAAPAFPRELQGGGRHDAPDLYGCLYVSERPLSAVVEHLARFRGTPFGPELLRLGGLPLALETLELAGARLVDLDDPAVLVEEGLRPSLVACRDRGVTQAQARALFQSRPAAVGIRWWSAFDTRWANVTLFDRARDLLLRRTIRLLLPEGVLVGEARRYLGLGTGSAGRSRST
jgi:hypothetical protein